MNTAKIVRFSCIFVALLSVLLLRTGVEATTSPLSKLQYMTPFAPWASNITNNELIDVAALAPNNVWAVGDYQNTGSTSKTLIEHWNGATWSIIPSPSPGANLFNVLYSVAAIAPNNVWAVGYYGKSTNTSSFFQTLIEHWNGIKWSVVPSPNPSGGGSNVANVLFAVTATSANNVWAVGYYLATNSDQTLVEHWNGATWSVVSTPQVGSLINAFIDVTAPSAQNVWAVGEFANNTSNPNYQTLTEHWDGTTWSVIPSTNPVGQQNADIGSIALVSSNDIWGGGVSYNTSNDAQPLLEHWNGASWNIIQNPNPGSTYYAINDVTSTATNDVWAAGLYADRNNIAHTLTEHWNGTTWSIVPCPNFGGAGVSNDIYAVKELSPKNVWAMGVSIIGKGNSQVLIEHWNGSSWSIIPPGH